MAKIKKVDVMKNVDILELVVINIFEPHPGQIQVAVTPLDKTKKIVFDETALKKFNEIITEKCQEMDMNSKDPKTREYIKEFVSKMTGELHRNGLVEICDIGEVVNDPYQDLRKQYGN